MRATLYSLSVSPPGHSARMMLERKGVETKVVDLLPGMHPVYLWARGFRRGTVPAVRFDNGRRVETSCAISRALDELVLEQPLFPADPARRAQVEEAERWGDVVLQNLPRQLIRYALANDSELRTWFAREVAHVPLPSVAAALNAPVARLMTRRAGADEAGARSALATLPSALDHVDALIADGTIGGEDPNAADFQIVTSVRNLMDMEDTAPLASGRPCASWAEGMMKGYKHLPSVGAIRALRS
ncbi:MAG TPA: glutathione S-transferase family protein [Conexibacter sp.]|jgi:glutathione S-transferase